MRKERLVTDPAEARANIDRYEAQLAASAELQSVMGYARSWHGYMAVDGRWRVAPSKFVGYADNDAATYVRTHRDRDGRRTERVLAAWSQPADGGTAAHDDMTAAILNLFARYGRAPNKLFRLNVLKTGRDRLAVKGEAAGRGVMAGRITVDPAICSGRPTIRGMRIRVSDVLDMLAEGASREDILADYPYLEDADISAALSYAARTADHRVVRVA